MANSIADRLARLGSDEMRPCMQAVMRLAADTLPEAASYGHDRRTASSALFGASNTRRETTSRRSTTCPL